MNPFARSCSVDTKVSHLEFEGNTFETQKVSALEFEGTRLQKSLNWNLKGREPKSLSLGI